MTDDRKKKTPAERAQEALDVASRRVERLTGERDKHQAALTNAESALEAALARRDYLAQDPDLPPVQNAATDTPVEPGAGTDDVTDTAASA